MVRAYKAEFILGLIGSIVSVVAFILSIVFGVAQNTLHIDSYIVSDIMTGILLLASFVLGFVGTFKLRRDDKGGGILLITAGGLSLIAMISGLHAAWFAFFSLPLTLTGGIMALSRRPHPPQQKQ